MKNNIIIKSAKYLEGYKIKITFSDGKINTFDYENLVMRDHEESIPYRNVEKFKKFSIVSDNTEIAWGKNWDMILPLSTIYNKTKVSCAGRKPVADKKILVRLYIHESIVKLNGGIEFLQKKFTEIANNKNLLNHTT